MALTMTKFERNLKLIHEKKKDYCILPPFIFRSVLHVSVATVV